jgi:TolB-like protein/class 3 adenylate cyclase
MSEGRVERRLAAILAADVAGYSRLIGADEEGTLAALKTMRREVIDPTIAAHRGRIVKTTGDGLLAEFASVVDALRCAAAWQAAVPADGSIAWRIGINVGDIVVEDGDIFGDGVNVAARLEALAAPGGICVSARVQEDAAGKLDLVFEDLGEQSLKNIARPVRVYRASLTRLRVSPGATLSRDAGEGKNNPASLPPLSRIAGDGVERSETGEGSAPLALPDKPSIAVLPFQNMSGDPEQEYFADGMVEEIITALSRIRWLFVIARNSSFTYKGQHVDIKQVGRELGVRYVLEGSVRKGGNRVRITAQLVEAETGAHLWADRFDGSMEEVFDLQDKVASSVAGVIEPALQVAEIRRSAQRPTKNPTAYDLYLRAQAIFFPLTQERLAEAQGLLEKAITIDPNYGPALAWAAICHMRRVIDGWAGEPETIRREGIELARRALQVAANDPDILVSCAQVLALLGEDIGAAITLLDRALMLNPSSARGWLTNGILNLANGQPDLAIEHIETSLRLSPRERIGIPHITMGQAHFFKREFQVAEMKLLLCVQDNPGYSVALRFLASCYAHMGQLDKARAVVGQLRAITSEVIPSHPPWRKPEDLALLLSGLRLAMGETG